MSRYFVVFSFLTGYSCVNLNGQNLVHIQTDRPDQTECPFIVPKNHFQMENGLNYERVDNSEKNFFYPTTLWKFGINENLEFRLITEFITNKKDEINTSGINPIKIGFKTRLLNENGLIPQTSFIGHLAIPNLATTNFATSYFAPSFRFTMQHSLSEKIALGYNLGAEWDGESAAPTFIYTLTTGFSLSEKFGAYIEIYGFAPDKEKSNHRFVGGISYNIKPNILIDFSSGVGITNNAPSYYGSLGFSIRLPD